MAQGKTIEQDLKIAMKAKDQLKVSVLRMVLSALHNEEIAKRKPLEEDEVNRVLSKEVKKRQEAVELYRRGNRPELADKEEAEMKIIGAYLPQMMSEIEVKEVVERLKAKGELGTDFGLAMRAVLAQVKGRADGKMVAEAVKSNL